MLYWKASLDSGIKSIFEKETFSIYGKEFFFTKSIHKLQDTIHIMISMINIRCKMTGIQNKRAASEELNFTMLTVAREVRNPTIKEFVQVIKEFKIPVKKVFID